MCILVGAPLCKLSSAGTQHPLIHHCPLLAVYYSFDLRRWCPGHAHRSAVSTVVHTDSACILQPIRVLAWSASWHGDAGYDPAAGWPAWLLLDGTAFGVWSEAKKVFVSHWKGQVPFSACWGSADSLHQLAIWNCVQTQSQNFLKAVGGPRWRRTVTAGLWAFFRGPFSTPTATKRKFSVAGTRTRVSRVRAEYPNQLDYNGFWSRVAYNISCTLYLKCRHIFSFLLDIDLVFGIPKTPHRIMGW